MQASPDTKLKRQLANELLSAARYQLSVTGLPKSKNKWAGIIPAQVNMPMGQ